ncbi:putative protein of unknown function [Pseudozyma hubeiensis SY62]|uniref:YMC020W-like alpha/beta hydrolase domain-containing protein n=1 Tax=Pseudozyma hubeiensis (strain SY62) TaxID=1305764 RepID=R9PCH5_PSEHS|nr:putative protein of unknown function [Pseudozyma hubeiensis SY62]GAC99108.1 putative protein of unknown function [Pseudozyma hubeiensis SY62]
MPFAWTHDRAAAPSTSAAPSGRISASPTETRRANGHRRGLPHSTSLSSNVSDFSTSGRSASGSHFSTAPPPSSLSLAKASTSAALVSTDESDDFRRFLDEALAKDDLQRRRQAKRAAANLAAPGTQASRRPGAAESLRRVASSSTLNSINSQQAATARIDQIPAQSSSMRQTSTLTAAAASRAPRSISNYSVTFRNPTSQFLEQLSVEAQTPELGIDDTPISGRSVDTKNHLTALGHAAQLQSRSASASHSTRAATIKGKAPAVQQPTRSSTIAVETPTATASRPTNAAPQPSVSASPRSPQAAPTNTLRITSPTVLSPRRRPQSYIHKPPSEASGVVSPRKLGATGLGHGLPTSPGTSPIQAKRSADQMERSASLQPSAKDEETTNELPAQVVQQSPNQSASRRRTWFGLGWAAESEAKTQDPQDEPILAAEAIKDQPPPPMNEDEAAFRKSLGYPDSSQSADTKDDVPKVFPGGRDSDATIKAESQLAQVPIRERRASWLPWRSVAPLSAGETTSSAAEDKVDGSAQQKEQQQSGELQESGSAAFGEAKTQGESAAAGDEVEDTVTYRTVVKRGWMGARYEVQEPVTNSRDVFNHPSGNEAQASGDGTASTQRNDEEQAGAQASQSQPAQPAALYPPPAAAGDADAHVRQTSGTWRWRFWSGHEDRPEVEPISAAQQLQVPDTLSAPPAAPAEQARTEVDTAVPMDIDQDGPAADATTVPDGGSWTYSSYVASWVPTWVYNAQQQQEAAASADAAPAEEVDADTGARLAVRTDKGHPRTPAEQVKADALARDTSAAVFDANKAVLNDSTRSGWIKFFASRSANLPREAPEAITDGDGVEVMDISEMESAARPAAARTIAPSNGRLTPDVSRAPRPRTTTGGSLAGSKASSLAGDAEAPRPATPLSTSKESVKNLTKTAITKAANVKAAANLSLGKGKRGEASQSGGADAGSSSQPAKDISKKVAPNGSGPSRSGASTPTRSANGPGPIAPANLVLPSFDDTFARAPRMWAPKVGVLERTLSAVNSYLFSKVPDLERMKRPTRFSTYGESSLGSSASSFKGNAASFAGGRPVQRLAGKAKATGAGSSKDKGVETALKEVAESAQRLPRAWSTVGMPERAQTRGTAGTGKIVVIGVHGWFTQSIFKNMIGENTGTSAKFAAMQTDSIRRHFLEAGLELNPEAITAISLQGDGKVADRVDRLFSELISRPNWVNDLKTADAIFLSAHSQGAIVATQLLARLIEQRHVRAESTRICLLAMCGIHHGPFAHLKSSITASYINYFETAAAKELFEFQSSSTAVAQQYTAALKIVLDAGTKCVYVGSTDDNVVPIYSALNSSNNHPSILRALYIDGQAFPKVDFLTNLLVLCVAVRNAGLSDHNLLTLLSASVAGSLYGGLGHSKVYEEKAVYDLATRYLFEVTHPLNEPTFVPGPPGISTNSSASGAGSSTARRAAGADEGKAVTLVSEAFEAQRWNPYELPWSLRGLFEDKHVRSLFAEDMLNLLQSYDEWKPDSKSKALKDLQWRLAPVKSIKPPEVEADEEEGGGGAQSGDAKETEAATAGSGKGSKL